MQAALKKAAPIAALVLAAATLSGCVLEPASYGGAYYAQPAPVYGYNYGPRYYYGPRYHYGPSFYYGQRWGHWNRHRWNGGGWRGGHHWH